MNTNIYISIDEAREEIKKRWNNEELKNKVEKELGEYFMSQFLNKPRGVLFRQICPADNGFEFFYYCNKYLSIDPLILEYQNDLFVHFNEEKKGLGRLRIKLENGNKGMVDIINFFENERLKLKDIRTKTGEKLSDFHHKLFKLLGHDHDVEIIDNSQWFHSLGKAHDYYYYLLLHFVAHGVLFEVFQDENEDKKESEFNEKVVFPALKKIKNKFNLEPMFVRLYPDNQSKDDDFFWWCFPPIINNWLVNFANKNKLIIKNLINKD